MGFIWFVIQDQQAFRQVMQQVAKVQEIRQSDGSSRKCVVLK